MKSSAGLGSTIKDKTLTITLDRPEKHNCFGIPELVEMQRLMRDSESSPEVRAVVFRGAGDRSFSTGADLNQFTGLDKAGTAEWIQKGHEVFNYIEMYPKPTVAVIQGYALGGGLELALACDFRIASGKATFGSPELQHGWLPGWGGINRLKRLLGTSRAKEIVFLGEHIPAAEAFRIGLINRLTEPEHLEQETETVLEKLRTLDPDVFAMAKTAISKPAGTEGTTRQDAWFDILSTIFVKG